MRDLLDADLRWRDPDGYRAVFRAVRAHAMHEVRGTKGRQQQAAIADLKFLFRNLRSVLSPIAWDQLGERYPDRAVEADRDDILRLVASAEGTRSAALAGRWFDSQREGFHVVRGADGTVRGVVGLLDLTAASDEDRERRPGHRGRLGAMSPGRRRPGPGKWSRSAGSSSTPRPTRGRRRR